MNQQVNLYRRVHVFLSRSAGNPFMEGTLIRYIDLSVRIWLRASQRIPNPFVLLDGHDQILDAVATGDGRQARACLVGHVAHLENAVREVL